MVQKLPFIAPSDRGMDKEDVLHSIYTMEYYSAIKKKWNNTICTWSLLPGFPSQAPPELMLLALFLTTRQKDQSLQPKSPSLSALYRVPSWWRKHSPHPQQKCHTHYTHEEMLATREHKSIYNHFHELKARRENPLMPEIKQNSKPEQWAGVNRKWPTGV